MTTGQPQASEPSTAKKSGAPTGPIIFLLGLALFIHALDRGNFSVAAPLITGDLKLTNTQLGILTSAFFWTYVPGHALSGWLVERYDAYRVLALGLIVWSVATFLTGFAGGFASLLVLRLLLGLGESSAFPASSKLLSLLVPQGKLATANALTGAGLMLGNGAGLFIGGMLVASFGWHMLFFVFGAMSLLWLVPWLLVKRPEPINLPDTAVCHAAPRYAEMLGKRAMWGSMIGHFCANYPFFLVLLWLPKFLVSQYGFALTTMAWLGGSVFVIATVTGLIGARITDGWIARGGEISWVRKSMMFASGAVAVVCMLACALGDANWAVFGLLGFGLSIGLGLFSIYSIGQTLAGPRAAGKWVGLQNGFAGLAGATSPLLTGLTIDATGSYRIAFLIATGVAIFGMLCWGLMIRKIEPIVWSGQG